jgi:hypothetical protein
MKGRLFNFFCMMMGFFFSLITLTAATNQTTPTIEEETQWTDSKKIDQRIEELKQMKKGYEAKAIYHDNQAQRLQFIEGQLQLAKNHMKLADANREVAKKIQSEIDLLEARKQVLMGNGPVKKP